MNLPTLPTLVFIVFEQERPRLLLMMVPEKDFLIKRHGRWASENAKDGYVKDRIESRLSFSKSPGI